VTHAQSMQMLRDAYPREDFPDRTVALYAAALEAIPAEVLTAAVHNIVARSRFLPRVSEILEECAELALDLPTAEQAWGIAERGSLRDAHEAVRRATDHVGGRWQILHSDNIPTVRAQFVKAYENIRREYLDEYRTGRARELPAGSPGALSPTMAALPETTRIRPRPVMARLSARWAGRDLAPPTEEEKADAIEYLREGPAEGGGILDLVPGVILDPLYQEAERIFAEGGITHGDALESVVP